MDKRETTRLFRLLGEIYPSAPEFSREESMLAWQLVLEPFRYEDVKAAVVEWAQNGEKREYPPRVSELTAKLTSVKRTAPSVKPAHTGSGYAWQKYIEDNHLEQDDAFSVSRYARERGISWHEAKRLGVIDRMGVVIYASRKDNGT